MSHRIPPRHQHFQIWLARRSIAADDPLEVAALQFILTIQDKVALAALNDPLHAVRWLWLEDS